MNVVVASIGALGIVLMYAGMTARGRSPKRRQCRLDRYARDAGLPQLRGRRMIAVSAGVWVATFVLAAGLTTSIIVASTLASVAAWTPVAVLRTRAERRRRGYGEAWPDALATLIAAVRAGVSLPEACIGLTQRGPTELAHGFRAFAATYRASGSFSASLQRLRDELSDPIADRVAVALAMAHEVGGSDLVRVLRALGDFVREDLRVKKEIEARWSWTVTAARVAAGAPWIVLLMMSTRPEAARAYDSVTGGVVIALGAAATLIGYRLMLRAARLPEEVRLPR